MSKRFTDTEKWKDEWFDSLSNEMKLFWVYLCDNCNHAGIWKVNRRLAEYHIKGICWDNIEKEFNGRILPVNNEKWFIKKFIQFQYPRGLSKKFDSHRSVINILNQYDLNNHISFISKSRMKQVSKIHDSCIKDKDKDKDIRKDVDVNVKVKDVKDVDVTTLDSITTIYNNILEKWNSFVLNGRSKLPKVVLLSNSRKNKLKVRLEKKEFDFDDILKAIDEQPWLFGNNDREWCISFDWIIENDTNFLKVLERKYKYLKTEEKK
jgi:hypothetical protein